MANNFYCNKKTIALEQYYTLLTKKLMHVKEKFLEFPRGEKTMSG